MKEPIEPICSSNIENLLKAEIKAITEECAEPIFGPRSGSEWDEMAMGNARMEAIKRMEINGDLVPDCPGCRERYEYKGMPYDVFAPRHKASSRCQSGRRAHCTCDTCF